MAEKTKERFQPREHVAILFLLIIVIWFFGSVVIRQIQGNLLETMEITKTVLEDVNSGYGLLHGQEFVIDAPAEGSVEQLVPEGQRVRKGNAVFRIGDAIAYTNNAGHVSYQLDGLEETMDVTTICATNLEERYAQQTKTGTVREAVLNEPYAKVINVFDDVDLYVTVGESDYVRALEEGQNIPVRFVDLDYEVQAKVLEAVQASNSTMYLKLRLNAVEEKVFQQRIYKIELPYNRMEAIAIPEKALVEKKGEKGVYYLQKGFVFWEPVTVGQTWKDLGMIVIEDGLNEGDLIVVTPHMVREGENIKF